MLFLSLKNRIAAICVCIMAILNILLLLIIYGSVKIASYDVIDDFLEKEVMIISRKYKMKDGVIHPSTFEEWQEKEHKLLGRHSVFIQFLDVTGKTIEKSPNLKDWNLQIGDFEEYEYYNMKVYDFIIRQIHIPIVVENETIGYIIIGTPIQETVDVLNILKYLFLASFPILLIILFIISKYIANKCIKPIREIIKTANKITETDISSRISLPHNRDELYVLSVTINNLLDRIEKVVEREQSFISFTSHEFKTPLSVIKGTLQVLIRKPREIQEYEQKSQYCISQVDKLNSMIEDLLLLTQYETNRRTLKYEKVNVYTLIIDILSDFRMQIEESRLKININLQNSCFLITDYFMFATIMKNLISNAIKYSFPNEEISIYQSSKDADLLFIISNKGNSIKADDKEAIFNPFYRVEGNIKNPKDGHGLGLSIVKEFCLLLGMKVMVESENNCTKFIVSVPNCKT